MPIGCYRIRRVTKVVTKSCPLFSCLKSRHGGARILLLNPYIAMTLTLLSLVCWPFTIVKKRHDILHLRVSAGPSWGARGRCLGGCSGRCLGPFFSVKRRRMSTFPSTPPAPSRHPPKHPPEHPTSGRHFPKHPPEHFSGFRGSASL